MCNACCCIQFNGKFRLGERAPVVWTGHAFSRCSGSVRKEWGGKQRNWSGNFEDRLSKVTLRHWILARLFMLLFYLLAAFSVQRTGEQNREFQETIKYVLCLLRRVVPLQCNMCVCVHVYDRGRNVWMYDFAVCFALPFRELAGIQWVRQLNRRHTNNLNTDNFVFFFFFFHSSFWIVSAFYRLRLHFAVYLRSAYSQRFKTAKVRDTVSQCVAFILPVFFEGKHYFRILCGKKERVSHCCCCCCCWFFVSLLRFFVAYSLFNFAFILFDKYVMRIAR